MVASRRTPLLFLLFLLFLCCPCATTLLGQGEDSTEALFMAPLKIFPGSESSVALHTFSRVEALPRQANFEIRFQRSEGEDTVLAQGKTDSSGWATAAVGLPSQEPPGLGRVVAEVEGILELLEIPVTVVETPVVLVDTDKPIYKPSQTIQGRVLVLNNTLRPLERTVEVEIRDAKQNKIFRRELSTNAFGVAPFELGLADELNTGEWTVSARSGETITDLTVRVEPYVLPRFRVEVELDKGWFLVDEPITGNLRSSYFFDKTVEGELTVEAHRLVGDEWQPYASHTTPVHDGEARFEIEPVQYVPETGEGGGGAVSLELTVTDSADHKETVKQLVTISNSPCLIRLLTMTPSAKPGLPYEIHVETLDPTGAPITRSVAVSMDAVDDDGGTVAIQERNVITQGGKARVTFTIPAGVEFLILEAESVEGPHRSTARRYGPVAYSPSGSFLQLVPQQYGPVSVGDAVSFSILSSEEGATYYEVLGGGRSVHSGRAAGGIQFQATPAMAPEAKVTAYRIFPNKELGADTYSFQVRPSAGVTLEVDFDAEKVEPGAAVKVQISADVPSMVGLAVVDESVLALGQNRLDLSRVYREFVDRFGGLSEAERQDEFIERPHTIGAQDVLSEAGVGFAVSRTAGTDHALKIPQGYLFWGQGKIQRGGYGLEDFGDGAGLAEVTRVRQFFPETWVWQPTLMTDTAGRATVELTAPDSITNWKLRAVSTSESGLGLAAGDLVVFQEFFVEPDLPYAVTRGEELWLPVAVYNYLDASQDVLLELEPSEGFEILGQDSFSVSVEPNSVTGASFPIRATGIGTFPFKLTARGPQRADALIRSLRVEPEGTRQEIVLNQTLNAGEQLTLDTSFPAERISGSEKLVLSITGSQVAQTIQGVEDLVGKPYG